MKKPARRGLRFEATDLAAGTAKAGIRTDGVMADFAGAHAVAEDEPGVGDEAAADAGAEGDEGKIGGAFAAPIEVLTQRRAARIIKDVNGVSEPALESRSQRHVEPAKVIRETDDAGFFDDIARATQPDSFDVSAFELLQHLVDRGFDFRDDGRAFARREVAFDAVLHDTALADRGRADMRAPEIDADRPFHHRPGSLNSAS